MAPINPYLSNQLLNLIYYNLDNNLVKNALFLASRLHACEPRQATGSYLLALCHLRLGQYKSAYEYSRAFGSRGVHLGCAYVFAQACLELGRWQDGIQALERSRGLWGTKNNLNRHTETSRRPLPDAAAIYCLMGKLWFNHSSVENAVDCYVEALKLNPFMWDAFTGLCDTGVDAKVYNVFKLTPDMLALLSSGMAPAGRGSSMTIAEEIPPKSGPLQTQQNNNVHPPNLTDPFNSGAARGEEDNGYSAGHSLFQKLNERIIPPVTSTMAINTEQRDFDEMNTPVPGGASSNDHQPGYQISQITEPVSAEPPRAPMRKSRMIHAHGIEMGGGPAAPKMRPATLTKTRTGSRSGDLEDNSDSTVTSRTVIPSLAGADRKRTISGQVARMKAVEDPSTAPQRRSARLFSQIRPTSRLLVGTSASREAKDLRKVKATGTKGRLASSSSTSSRAKNPDEMDVDARDANLGTGSSKAGPVDIIKQEEAVQYLLDLFLKLGAGYYSLCHYQCDKALELFNSVPAAQRDTPWVLAQIGRAHFEQSEWAEAVKYFCRIREMTPTRVEDMEIFSTCLWFLKKDIELAHLAHELMDLDRMAPQTWCTLGNSFSLRKDHDQAVKCFQRATQLDPRFAYAFTLQGHEHMLNEEFDKAQTAYRNAISADNRHYNAWYGLGKVNERLGKLDMAEKYFQTAANINRSNAVLVCCVGTVLEKLKNPRAALVQYNLACDLAPKSALSRFRKARVLMQLQELDAALAELMILKDIAPDEANVHFLLGKLYKMLRQKPNAIKHFTSAFQLDPKVRHYS
jgi:anaphase-promoting complex subunit 3